MIYSGEPKLDRRKSLGARLVIVRGEQRKTQDEFAKIFKVSPRAYHDFERGKRAVPSDLLIDISHAFDVNLNWLMRGLEVPSLVGYEERVEAFVASLHRHLEKRRDKLSPEGVAAIVSRWLTELKNGREVSLDDVHIWIDLMRKVT